MLGETTTKSGRVADPRVRNGIPAPVEALIALGGLVVSAPLLALAALAIAATSRGPVLFRQTRVGQAGRQFRLFKLRTMSVSAGGAQVTASDDRRVTGVGRILRRTKLDELPELWNVLKGDMSLVGPRPEVPRYVELDDPLWRLVLRARPGITDPMTIHLRNEEALLSEVKGDRERFYVEVLQAYKLRGYVEYLQRRSWQSDVKVLWRTAVAVILPSRTPPPTVAEVLTSAGRRPSGKLHDARQTPT